MNQYKTLWSRDINVARLKMVYATFSGRATRREYWDAVLLAIAVAFVAGILGCVAAAVESGFFMFISAIAILVAILATVPVSVRRLHDRNMDWWWLLVFFVVGLVPGLNLIVWIAQLVILGFLDGIPGANRFGDDPKGRRVEMTDQRPFYGEPADVKSRLEKLASMREEGVLTEEEYAEQRANIISQI